MAIKDDLTLVGLIASAYAGVTIAVNALVLPMLAAQNGLERAVGRTEETTIAEVVDKQLITDHNGSSYGILSLQTQDGRTLETFDRADVLEGKFLPNRIYSKVEPGHEYTIVVAKSFMGNNIISAQPVEKTVQ